MRAVPFVFLIAVSMATSASAQIPPGTVVDTVTLDNGHQRLTANVVSITTTISGSPADFRGIRLGKLTNVDDGSSVLLDDSPIWRLDLRRLIDLDPSSANPVPYSGWLPLPDLNPQNNIAVGAGHSSAWVDIKTYPQAEFGISLTNRRRLLLEWKNLPIERWHSIESGQVDVTVQLGFVPKKPGIHGSIEVRMRSGANGKASVALMSVSFPELLLDPLNIGTESEGDTEDDILLSPYRHGYLIPNPIDWLAPTNGFFWGPDTFATDFAPGFFNGDQARLFTYPGDCSTQFLYLYDPAEETDAQEDWIKVAGNDITGYGRRPSLRRESGAGLYVAAHDPDVNVKRILHDVIDQGSGNQLRLGIRTFVEFASDRLEEMKTPGVGKPGALWQRYAQGPFVKTAVFDPNDERVAARDPSFSWPVVIELLEGDWLDATERYRQFFVAESNAIRRDLAGNAIRLRDLPATMLPRPYDELIGTIDLLDVTPQNPPATGAPVVVARADNVRNYIDYMREDWVSYQPLDESKELPVYLVTHREGMVKGELPFPGQAVASAGNGGFDRIPRPLLPEFLVRLRDPEPRWPPKPWEARVLAGISRDHGSLELNNPFLFPGIASVFRETGHEALVDIDVWLTSYARPRAASNLIRRIERTLVSTQARNEELETYLTQIDLIELDGPGAAATPDYTEWIPQWRTRNLPIAGVGGGNRWFKGHDEMRRSMREDPVLVVSPPAIGFSTGEFNEAVLQRNLPIGPRTPFPATAIDDDVTRLLSVFAEPVMLTSYLYHDYAILRGSGVSFARPYAMPIDEVPLVSGLDPRYFDQTMVVDRGIGHRLSLYHLTREIVHGGLLSGVAISTTPGLTFENDDGGDGAIASYDDRLCLSDGRTAGPFDTAKGGWASPSPPSFTRDLFRARSQMRAFFIGGRRARDPVLTDPDDDPSFFADDLFVKRWSALDLSNTIATYNGGENEAAGGMNVERIIFGTYIDDGPLDDNRRHRLMICVANPSPAQITYQMLFDPLKWNLPKGETYTMEALDLKLQKIPLFGTATGVKWSSGNLRLPKQVNGAHPHITGWGVHFWVLRRTS